MAGAAFGCNFRTFAITSRAGAGGLHLAQYGIGYPAYGATTATGTAGAYRRFVFCPRTTTALANHLFVYFYFFLNAFSNFFEGEFYFNAQVAATGHTASATCRLPTAKKTIEWATATTTENIAKLAKNIFHVHVAGATAKATLSGSGMSKLVVTLFFLGVAQYLVGLGSFLKFIFRSFIVGVFIRMVFNG